VRAAEAVERFPSARSRLPDVVQGVPEDVRRSLPPAHPPTPPSPEAPQARGTGRVVHRDQECDAVRGLWWTLPSRGDDLGSSARNKQGRRRELAVAEAQPCVDSRRDRKMRAGLRQLSCCTVIHTTTGRSSAWLERRVWDAEAAGSNPAVPTDLPSEPVVVARVLFRLGAPGSPTRGSALQRQVRPGWGRQLRVLGEQNASELAKRIGRGPHDLIEPLVLASRTCRQKDVCEAA
jgi:hypothetical protein